MITISRSVRGRYHPNLKAVALPFGKGNEAMKRFEDAVGFPAGIAVKPDRVACILHW